MSRLCPPLQTQISLNSQEPKRTDLTPKHNNCLYRASVASTISEPAAHLHGTTMLILCNIPNTQFPVEVTAKIVRHVVFSADTTPVDKETCPVRVYRAVATDREAVWVVGHTDTRDGWQWARGECTPMVVQGDEREGGACGEQRVELRLRGCHRDDCGASVVRAAYNCAKEQEGDEGGVRHCGWEDGKF